MMGRSRWISSMNRMSPARRFVSVPTRSPGFSSAGPLVVRMFTPSSRAISSASVVLPSPGGPWKSVWSSGSRRPSAAWIAMSSESFTFACPMNSASALGRSESSTTDSSLRTSGVVISARDMRANLALLQHGERRADHVAGRAPRAGVLERAPHGLLRVVRGIAERDQGAHGVGGYAILLRWRARGRFGADEILHLVAELHAKPFGDLLADARHALQRAEVAIADRAHHAPASERGDQAEREGGSHAARGEERVKERAGFRAAESEQLPAVFLHDQRRVQRDLLADARQRLEHAQRNEQFVSHAAGGHDLDAIDALRDQRPLEARDHPAIRRWSFAVP